MMSKELSRDDDRIADLARKLTESPSNEAEESTLRDLRKELETLADSAKNPFIVDGIDHEPELSRGIESAKKLGRELAKRTARSKLPSSIEVKRIREYEILELLGRGGMGAVYLANHTKLRRAVALKVLPSERLSSPGNIERFEREMAVVGSLSHPNIVTASDAGEVDGTNYLVMELIDGYDLSALVKRVGCLRIADACEVIRQSAKGLSYAHQRSIIHRDIKPSNIMLARQENGVPIVKLLDLGLALLIEQDPSSEHGLTDSGQMMGTFDYMAPEQGVDSHAVDVRADVYALGATLFKLLTSEAPFDSRRYNSAFKLLTAKTTKTSASISTYRTDVPEELEDLVGSMLAIDPDARPSSAEEVIERLERFASESELESLMSLADTNSLAVEPIALTDTKSIFKTGVSVDTATSAQSKSAEHLVPEPNETEQSRNWLLTAIGIAIIGVIAFGVVVKFQTKKGLVVIETEGVEISEILLGDTAVTLARSEDGKRFEFSADPTTAELTVKTANGTVLETSLGKEPLTIRAGPNAKLKAWLVLADPSTGEPKPISNQLLSSTERERRFAKWVFEQGGEIGWWDSSGIRSIEDFESYDGELSVSFKGCEGFGDRDTYMLTQLYPYPDRDVKISLMDTGISDESIKHLRLIRCDVLRMERTEITDECVVDLMQLRNITQLYVSYTNLTGKSLGAIASLPRLQVLTVDGLHLQDDEIKPLANLELHKLAISSNPNLTDESMKTIAKLPSLGCIALPKGITDTGIGYLRKSKLIRELTCHSAEISDKSAAVIGDFSNLTHLDIGGTHFSDHLLVELQDNKKLAHLYASGTEVSGAGIAAFKQANPNCKITYSFRSLKEPEQRLFHWANANRVEFGWLSTTGKIASIQDMNGATEFELDFRNAKFDNETLRELQGLETNFAFHLNLNGTPVSDQDLVYLAGMRCATLHLDGTKITDEGASKLRGIKGIIRLCLCNTRMTSKSLDTLADLPILGELGIAGMGLTDKAFSKLRGANLRSLSIANEDKLTDPSLEIIGTMRGLESLSLPPGLSDRGLRYLKPLSKLRTLIAQNSPKITDDSADLLGSFKHMKYMALNNATITGVSLRELAGCQSLERLILNGCRNILPEDIGHLASITNLVNVELDGTRSNDAVLRELSVLPKLSRLRLFRTKISDDGLASLAKCNSLTYLNVQQTSVSKSGIAKLQKTLPNCIIESDFSE